MLITLGMLCRAPMTAIASKLLTMPASWKVVDIGRGDEDRCRSLVLQRDAQVILLADLFWIFGIFGTTNPF